MVLGAILVPASAAAQSASQPIEVSATVAAEESYTAFEITHRALERGMAVELKGGHARGVTVEVREEERGDRRVLRARVVSVYFPGT